VARYAWNRLKLQPVVGLVEIQLVVDRVGVYLFARRADFCRQTPNIQDKQLRLGPKLHNPIGAVFPRGQH
jgi:hypothetical protein